MLTYFTYHTESVLFSHLKSTYTLSLKKSNKKHLNLSIGMINVSENPLLVMALYTELQV